MIFHTKMDSQKNRYGIVQPPTPVEEGLPSCHLLQVHKHYVQTTWVGLLSPNIVSTTSSPKTVNIFTDRSRAGEGWSTPYPAFKKKKKKDRFGACLYAFSICSWSLKGQRVCGIVRKLIECLGVWERVTGFWKSRTWIWIALQLTRTLVAVNGAQRCCNGGDKRDKSHVGPGISLWTV